jgi:dTDP-4-amino-4,6-dideoxygalactose transaminase
VCFPSREGAIYAQRARSLRSLGFTPEHDFRHLPHGHNYRLANLLATPILESLSIFDTVDKAKRMLEIAYDEACPPEWRMPRRQAPWVYDFRVPGMTYAQQDKAVKALQDKGVAARHCFKPLHLQPEYRGCKAVGGGNAERLSREVVYVPFSMNLPFPESHIFETVQSCLG